MTNRNVVFPLLILFTALVVRLTLFYFNASLIPVDGDSSDYLALADSLREGKGFSINGQDPTATRMPLYPLFLAGILSLPEAGIKTIQFFQVLLDSLTCLWTYFLARFLLDKTHGEICGMVMALYVPMGAWSLFIFSETLFTFFLVLAALSLAYNSQNTRFSAIAGLLIGIGTLARPNGIVVAFSLVLWFLYHYGLQKSLRHIAAFLLCMTFILAPWVVRNTTVFHRFIPTFTITGSTFYNSYFIPAKGPGYIVIKQEHNEYFSIENEADRDRYLTNLTLQHIKSNPWQALKLIPMKLSLLIYPFDMKWSLPGFPFRYNIFWGLISILAVLAVIARTSYIRDRLTLILFPIGALLLTTIIFYGSPRMRAPFDLFIALLGSVGALWVWQNRSRHIWIGVIVGLNILMIFIGESHFLIKLLKDIKPW